MFRILSGSASDNLPLVVSIVGNRNSLIVVTNVKTHTNGTVVERDQEETLDHQELEGFNWSFILKQLIAKIK